MLSEKLRNWFAESSKNSSLTVGDSDEFQFSIRSHIGLKRGQNQDRIAAIFLNSGGASAKSFYCFILCDGMGGMKDGDKAATLSISCFVESLIMRRHDHPQKRLLESALYANSEVQKESSGGTTLTAVLMDRDGVFSINAGDSRIYTKSTDGRINRHTTDDNLKEFAGGEDEGLLQYIGMGDGLRPHVQKIEEKFDMIFLTTDGVHSMEKSMFDKIVFYSKSASELCERLVSSSVWTGGLDNASVIAVSGGLNSSSRRSVNGAEIAVWNNIAEMQIIWAERNQDHSINEVKEIDDQRFQDRSGDATKSKNQELDFRGGKESKKSKSESKKHEIRPESKETFGDFG